MAIWKFACKTLQGMNLDLKLASRGDLALKLTRAVGGSGKTSPTQLMGLSGVLEPVQELQLLDAVEHLSENRILVPVILRNASVREGYSMYQLGVYAQDPDLGEILYLVMQSEGAEEIPSNAEMKDFKLEWYINLAVGNADNVEVVIDEAGVLTVEQADARYVSLLEYEGAVKELGAGIEGNGKKIEAHLKDTGNPHKVTPGQLGLDGALVPKGAVTFAGLPPLADVGAGHMYDVSDGFTTTADFVEGAGRAVPAGSNVYKAKSGKWDVLGGSPVTGVKGDKEASYHRGNVNLTPGNIGALPDETVPVSKGGTGQTSLEAAANALINSLGNGTAVPGDDTYIITQYAGGPPAPSTYHRRPLSLLWAYVKSKINAATDIVAAKAKQLSTARTIRTNLASTAAAGFDGSANVTPGVTGTLPVANGGTGNTAGNAATATKLQTARNINGLSFDGTASRGFYAVCSTSGAAQAKAATCAGYVLTVGSFLAVQFSSDNTAGDITLNVNSTGAKPIVLPNGNAAGPGDIKKTTLLMVYDGANWVIIDQGLQLMRRGGSIFGNLAINGRTDIDGAAQITGTLNLTKTTGLPGTANNAPALVIGPSAGRHMEFGQDEIHAKRNGTAPSDLNLNLDGGVVQVGPGGLMVRDGQYKIKIGTKEHAVIRAYDDGTSGNYGLEGVIQFGGNVLIGSGEAPANLITEYHKASPALKGETYSKAAENMYIASGSNIYFLVGCNDITKRVGAELVLYTTNEVGFAPITDLGGNLGADVRKWNNIYANKILTGQFNLSNDGLYGKNGPIITGDAAGNLINGACYYLVMKPHEDSDMWHSIPYGKTRAIANSITRYDIHQYLSMLSYNEKLGILHVGNNTMARMQFGEHTYSGYPKAKPNILLYKKDSSENSPDWAGIGASNDGTVHIRVGTAEDNAMMYSFTNGDGSGFQVTSLKGGTYFCLHADEYYTARIKCLQAEVTSFSAEKKYVPIKASAFTVSSSLRYKEDIKPITDEEAKKVLALNPVSFNYKEGCGGEKGCFGLIAEETEEVVPFAVQKDQGGNPDAIDYSKFTAHLIKMVQVQQGEINRLTRKNEELENRLARLEELLLSGAGNGEGGALR